MWKGTMLALFVCFLAACAQEEQSSSEKRAFPEPQEPYRSEQAIQNGDVVNLHSKVTNWERWEQFIRNIDEQKADKVRITSYTTEGDPIFEELVYDGKSVEYTHDDSMDKYGGKEKGRQVTICEGIDVTSESNGETVYHLKGCYKEFGQYFELSNKE